jgi:hypothetical protein
MNMDWLFTGPAEHHDFLRQDIVKLMDENDELRPALVDVLRIRETGTERYSFVEWVTTQ